VLEPATATLHAEYGFSFDQEKWTCGFSTREAALAEAMEEAEGFGFNTGFEVGRVVFNPINFPPRLAERMAETLDSGGRELGGWMLDELVNSNEEADWEDCFADAIAEQGPEELHRPARQALVNALHRLRLPSLYFSKQP
jgi:hypothetical protein